MPNFNNISHDNPAVTPGGEWKPAVCEARDQVAVIIPYRARPQHLPVLLKYLHPLLQRQLIHYRIFVVEQVTSHLDLVSESLEVITNEVNVK